METLNEIRKFGYIINDNNEVEKMMYEDYLKEYGFKPTIVKRYIDLDCYKLWNADQTVLLAESENIEDIYLAEYNRYEQNAYNNKFAPIFHSKKQDAINDLNENYV